MMEQKCVVAPVGTEAACGSTSDPVQVKILIIYYLLLSFIQLLWGRLPLLHL